MTETILGTMPVPGTSEHPTFEREGSVRSSLRSFPKSTSVCACVGSGGCSPISMVRSVSPEAQGRPASKRFGPLKLAARSGAPVLLAFARRDPDGRRHRLTIRPALQLESGASDDETVLQRNLQKATAEIEKEIRASPEQWIWTHRRWREQPDASDSG